MENREKELLLVKKIKDGDEKSWKEFVTLYSDTIFNSIRHWCQPYCRKSHHKYLCPWKIKKLANVDLSRKTCGDVIDMYIFSLEAIRKRVIKFRGESRLSTFIVASLKYIKLDFFRNKYGRLQLPLAIKKTSDTTKEVYKLLCKGKTIDHISKTLNISEEDVKKREGEIRNNLRKKGQEWQHLDGWIALKSEPLPLVSEKDSETIDYTPAYTDKTPEEREVISYMIQGLKKLSPVQRRLIQMRFQERMSVGEIEKAIGKIKFMNITTQKQIYKELDGALTELSKFIKSSYNLEQNISAEIKKIVKELLEKLMLSYEKDSP